MLRRASLLVLWLLMLGAVAWPQAQQAKVQGVIRDEPLLPMQALQHDAAATAPDGKRPVLVKWRYPGTTRTAPAVAVWLSVDGGPWQEIARTLPGALNHTYYSADVGLTHCTYLVPLSRSGIEGKPSPTICEYIDAIPTPTDVSVQAQ